MLFFIGFAVVFVFIFAIKVRSFALLISLWQHKIVALPVILFLLFLMFWQFCTDRLRAVLPLQTSTRLVHCSSAERFFSFAILRLCSVCRSARKFCRISFGKRIAQMGRLACNNSYDYLRFFCKLFPSRFARSKSVRFDSISY